MTTKITLNMKSLNTLYHGVRKKDGGRTVGLLPAYFWLWRVGFTRRRWRRSVRDRAAAGIGCAHCAASCSSDFTVHSLLHLHTTTLSEEICQSKPG